VARPASWRPALFAAPAQARRMSAGFYRGRPTLPRADRLGRVLRPNTTRNAKTKASLPRDVVLSRGLKDLQRINLWVNTNGKPMTIWIIGGSSNAGLSGRRLRRLPEDYALQKRKMLIQAGWPREALLITVVRDKNGAATPSHLKSDKGEYILDNQTNDILLVGHRYRFVKRQSQADPKSGNRSATATRRQPPHRRR